MPTGVYTTNIRRGRPTTNTFENLENVLKSKTYIDPVSDCWIWEGAKNKKGYGHTRIEYIYYTVSRLSAFLYLGLDLADRDTHALHKCPNKACWNPSHLYLGTNNDNWRDRKEGSEVTNLTREHKEE